MKHVSLPRMLAGVCLVAAAAGVASASAASSGSAGDRLVIEAGRVVVKPGEEIENGVIVIEGGRITAVGRQGDVTKPWDVEVIGGPEFVAFPGFVEAHTTQGVDRPNENIDVAAFLDVRDSIDPVSFYFEDCLRWGITTINVQHGANCVIGARGMVVRPVGLTVEEMSVRPDFGVKVSAAPKSGKSAATQVAALRRAFDELHRYLDKVVQDQRDGKAREKREALFQGRELEGEKDKDKDAKAKEQERKKGRAMEGTAWKVEGLEAIPRGEIDEKQAPLLEIVEGRRAVFLECRRPMEVARALDLARENGFLHRTTLVLGSECFKAADLVAEAGCPVVLLAPLVHVERDPVTGDEIETFVPKVFADKNVRFALASQNSSANSLWFQAAMATGLGLERTRALEAVTVTPAEILGLGDRVGTLEAGKDGNVLLLSGDPLSVTTHVDRVIVEGRSVYDRKDDVRLKHLLQGIEPRGTSAAAGQDEGDAKKDEPAEPGSKKAKDANGEKKDGEKKDGDEKQASASRGATQVAGVIVVINNDAATIARIKREMDKLRRRGELSTELDLAELRAALTLRHKDGAAGGDGSR